MAKSFQVTLVTSAFDWANSLSRMCSLVFEIPILGYLECFGVFGGHLATFGAKSNVIFLLGDPDFLLGRRNSRLSSSVIVIPILGYLGCFGVFWGYLATSGAKSDIIFLLGDPDFLIVRHISRLSSLVIEIPILGYLGCFGVFLGVFRYFRCKI